jgi:3-oxoacyl-[acyl-carrier-protein] synthase II
MEFGARAGVHTPVSACATGSEAIGYALNMIRTGRADIVVCGGTEAAIHPLPISAFANMMAMSKNNEDPKHASRPYDKQRDGFVLGEGAGILVLESAEHAAARGARVYAEIAGVGMSADSHDIAQPDPTGEGIAAAIRKAVEDGGIDPAQIVHLNAHATSTPLGDTGELRALRMALGDDAEHIAISATKSMTGHLLGGAGGIETVFAVKAVHELLAPPTINITEPDEAVDLDIVRDEPRKLPAETEAGPIVALNNSFGFGGHNVVLAVRRV